MQKHINQINLEATLKLKQDQKYDKFISWGLQNGLLMQGVDIPVAYGDLGLSGVAAKQDIPVDKIILAVPKSLLITPQCALNNTQLNYITKQIKREVKDKDDLQYRLLIVFMMYQRLKGQKSFYYPYFQIMPSKDFSPLDWSKQKIQLINFLQIQKEIVTLKNDITQACNYTCKLFKKYQLTFGKNQKQIQQIFWWSQNCIMTRSFGWSIPSTCLIPFADLFNHFDRQQVTHFMLDIQQQLNGPTSQNYKIKHNSVDCSLIRKIQKHPTKKLYNKFQKYGSHFGIKVSSDRDKAKAQIQNHYFGLIKQEVIDLKQFNFVSSSNTQDNDTQDQQKSRHQQIIKKIRQRQAKLMKDRYCFQLPATIINRSKLTNFQDDQYDDQQEIDWNSYSKQTYFAVSSLTAINKGQQLRYNYGKRSNKFLLLYYGFALQQNKYDSYSFRICMDYYQIKQKLEQIPQQILYFKNASGFGDQTYYQFKGRKCIVRQLSRELRLNKKSLNMQLIIFLRVFLLPYYRIKYPQQQPLALYATSLFYQEYVIQFYQHILNYLGKRLPNSFVPKDLIQKSIVNILLSYNQIVKKQHEIIKSAKQLLLMLRNKVPLSKAAYRLGQSQTKHLNATKSLSNYIRNLAETQHIIKL